LRPENFILLSSGFVNPISIVQERYLNIIYDVFRVVRRRYDLVSFAVYGSVARGNARDYSDIDILIISNDFRGSIASRIDELVGVEYEVGDEIRWLISNGVYASLSFYPLRTDEASRLPMLFLDLIDDVKIVYDNGFLEGLLDNLKIRISRLGAKRVKMDDGSWFWDLKPDFKLYEVVDLWS